MVVAMKKLNAEMCFLPFEVLRTVRKEISRVFLGFALGVLIIQKVLDPRQRQKGGSNDKASGTSFPSGGSFWMTAQEVLQCRVDTSLTSRASY